MIGRCNWVVAGRPDDARNDGSSKLEMPGRTGLSVSSLVLVRGGDCNGGIVGGEASSGGSGCDDATVGSGNSNEGGHGVEATLSEGLLVLDEGMKLDAVSRAFIVNDSDTLQSVVGGCTRRTVTRISQGSLIRYKR